MREDAADRCADQRRLAALRAAEESESVLKRLKRPRTLCAAVIGQIVRSQQTEDKGQCMKQSQLRAIPSVEKVLLALGDTGLPRPMVVDVVRRELAALRKAEGDSRFRRRARTHSRRAARSARVPHPARDQRHGNSDSYEFRPRSAGANASSKRCSQIGSNYNNLEYGLAGGDARRPRGVPGAKSRAAVRGRSCHRREQQCRRAGPDPAPFLRGSWQRAAARFRTRGRTKSSSRAANWSRSAADFGFPISSNPAARGCAKLARRTKPLSRDYARAIGRETALILKVHRSNFFMGGFVESPPTEEIAALARKKRVPFVEDLGSGAMIDTQAHRRPRTRAYARRSDRAAASIWSASAATSCSAGRRRASSPAKQN